MTKAKTKLAVCLVDNAQLNIKCGEVIELEDSVIDSLVKEGKADDNKKAVSARQENKED